MISNQISKHLVEKENNQPYIVCDNLVKIYKISNLEVVALQGLDLVVKIGEMLGIVGVSGSGKSTLLNILGGLDRPSAGRIWVDGNDLLNYSDAALDRYRREKVGFIWQQSSRNLIPYFSALENVELPMTLAGKTVRESKEHAIELLNSVGLADRMHHSLSELSGGEQQRVAIAVSLANKPRLLLADEPTGEVDEATSKVIYETLQNLNNKYNLTIMIVSHDPAISQYVDRVVAIRDGKTASETIRHEKSVSPLDCEDNDRVEELKEVYEELTVLDSAGRLQIPKEYLEMFKIRGRVRLEVSDEGIMILPVEHENNDLSAEEVVDKLDQESNQKGLMKSFVQIWHRIMERKDRKSD